MSERGWVWLHRLIPAVAAWVWFCTVANQSAVQVMSLNNVENYALAVFSQLFWGWSESGLWEQTIHFGYVDSWMWSGHRVGWLPFVGWLYGINPDPLWLCRIQIAAIALGAIPAYGLGRIVIHSTYGGLIGLVLYLGFPPLTAIALQDYQDLALSIPFLLGAIWQLKANNKPGFLLFSLGACMCREEIIPMVLLIALAANGSWRQRSRWVALSGLLVALYGALIWWLGLDFDGYDNPMMSHSGDMLVQWPPVISRNMEDVQNFYLTFFKPVHFLAVLAPITLLPAVGIFFFHLTAPEHGGVDTTWDGHIHHMAPVIAFIVASTMIGIGRIVRFTTRMGRFRSHVLSIAGAGLLVVTAMLAKPWMNYLGLSPAVTLSSPAPNLIAPEWALMADIPTDVSVATDSHMSVVISNRKHAYTYDESLRDKRPGEGLSALDFILVRKLDRSWVATIQEAGGVPVGETPDYELYDLR
jgi:uncharacterized membrane protein